VDKIDTHKSLKTDGVRKVFAIKEGVAVVASDFWAAKKGADALKISWHNETNKHINSKVISNKLRAALERSDSADLERNDGNAKDIIQSANTPISVEYEVPYQAHATLEPMTCTAYVHDGKCEIWAPTQAPTKSYQVASELTQSTLSNLAHRYLKMANDAVTVRTSMLGGGFGRRLQTDFVSEAVQISAAVNAPIRLIWTREEDIQHDFYRPTSLHRLSATLDEKGMPIAWWHSAAGPDLGMSGARDIPYAIPHIRVEGQRLEIPVPTGPWRSVSHSYNAFVIESFIDELATVHNHDPLEYRLRLLAEQAQYRDVLEQAAERAGWGKTLPDGHFHGLAVYKCFGTYVAQVAEISLDNLGKIRVHRVTAAIDAGLIVNPDNVISQLEGAITFGLSAALKGKITIKNGRVEQSNFHDFPVLRFDEMPDIDVVIIKNKKESPEGIGEPGVPSIAPAVANALFAATGQRHRNLPL
jgi:isoquinoline 1-oxidoreductase beta subunit